MSLSSLTRQSLAALCAVVIGVGTAVPAQALQIPNRDKVLSVRGEDGRYIELSKLNEQLRPVIPLAGNTFGHEGFIDVTGRVKLRGNGPRIRNAHLQVGYQVGCQVAITSLTVGGGHDVTLSPSAGRSATNTVGGNAGGNASVTPSGSISPSASISPSVEVTVPPKVSVGGSVGGSGTGGVSTTVGGNMGGNAQRSVTRNGNLGLTLGNHTSWQATVVPGGVTTVIFADLPFTGYLHAGVKLTNLEFNVASCAGIVSIRSFVRLIYSTAISMDNVSVYGQPRYL